MNPMPFILIVIALFAIAFILFLLTLLFGGIESFINYVN